RRGRRVVGGRGGQAGSLAEGSLGCGTGVDIFARRPTAAEWRQGWDRALVGPRRGEGTGRLQLGPWPGTCRGLRAGRHDGRRGGGNRGYACVGRRDEGEVLGHVGVAASSAKTVTDQPPPGM